MEQLWVFDGHCDTIYRCWREYEPLAQNSGALDLDRAQDAFGRYCQIFSLWTTQGYTGGNSLEDACRAQLCCFRHQMEINSNRIVHCRKGTDALEANSQGKAAAFLSVEGAELLGCSLEGLEWAEQEGVVAINLTWNYANALSGSHNQAPERGLTSKGREFVRRMEALGILVDVSHLSPAGFWDVMDLSTRPVIASHSNARAVCDHTRNLTNDQITAIIGNQGVIGLNFYHLFVGGREDLDSVRRHLDCILDLGGAKHIALGGDWDGGRTICNLPQISALEDLYLYLLGHNYPEEFLRDLFYNNLMRVVSQ